MGGKSVDFMFLRYAFTASACHEGRGEYRENPPPEVIFPPVSVEQTCSVPLAAQTNPLKNKAGLHGLGVFSAFGSNGVLMNKEVAPTDNTYGDAAGKPGFKAFVTTWSLAQSALTEPGAPLSPELATNVIPRMPSFINSTFTRDT